MSWISTHKLASDGEPVTAAAGPRLADYSGDKLDLNVLLDFDTERLRKCRTVMVLMPFPSGLCLAAYTTIFHESADRLEDYRRLQS
jgi:hypothetical protein